MVTVPCILLATFLFTPEKDDEGWETVFAGWLETSRIGPKDAVLVFSVGGGRIARVFGVAPPDWREALGRCMARLGHSEKVIS